MSLGIENLWGATDINTKRKIGIVLSGGGAKGAYEAGVLGSLAKKIESIQVMTGASIGAINAAIFAWNYEQTGDLTQAAAAVQAIWLELGNLFTISYLRIILSALISLIKTGSPLHFPSLAGKARIKSKLKGLIPQDLKISDLTRIELIINATSLTAGETVSFSRENDSYLLDAVLASSSIPLVFAAQNIKGGYYVDGGVFNNTPLRDAILAQATDIFVVELKPKSKDLYLSTICDQLEYDSVYRVGSRLTELILDKIMYEDLKNARKINEIIEVIQVLRKSGKERLLIRKLEKSIGFRKNGQIKRRVNFYEIAPSQRLDPPGTFGFGDKKAIREIMLLGAEDGEKQLAQITLPIKERPNFRAKAAGLRP
ncbi:MAG: hypothetical protein GX335_06785 [Firmicutes bacterium]|nr:hypothetical protein [Bacillota bacterium]